jgi:citrate synthase
MELMFKLPTEFIKQSPVVLEALDKLFILHADHEQNSLLPTEWWVLLMRDLRQYLPEYLLLGPLHGGANQAVLEM